MALLLSLGMGMKVLTYISCLLMIPSSKLMFFPELVVPALQIKNFRVVECSLLLRYAGLLAVHAYPNQSLSFPISKIFLFTVKTMMY